MGMNELLLLLVFLPVVALWIFIVIDVFKGQFQNPLDRGLWLLIVIFAPFIGALLYLAIGRKQKINYRR